MKLQKMKQATLCLFVRESQDDKELLLAMKKRGFGKGKWNGVGGKLDSEKGDKNIVEAAVRETEEEIGIRIKDLEKVAILNFRFPYIPQDKDWNQDVHVFLARNWEGEPIESEEMAPKWFKIEDIPFEEMWPDDKFWLPKILAGEKLKARFVFGEGEIITEQDIETVETFQ